MDAFGAPTAYHVLNQHPGDLLAGDRKWWSVVPAFGAQTGRRNVLHLYAKRRIGQTRGAPWLSGVIELFKQLGTYTESEVSAAVLAAMIAITTKTDDRAGLSPLESAVQGTTPAAGTADGAASSWDGTLTPGLAVDLGKNEEIAAFKSDGRPNPQFDPFVQAILRQAGAYLGLPFEVLIKHFTASYSAARAALLDAWRFYLANRAWLVEMFCQPVYEAWLEEAVALGRVQAPGFFDDPMLRAAYCRANWHGDGPARSTR
jgi:lambda family phage portal protein